MAGEITVSDKVLDPEVLADMTSAQLTAGLKFAAIADIDTTLEGKPGSTVEFPSWNYIGDAEDLQEGVPIETKALTYGTKAATIKEIGNGVEITDQTILTGYGDPMGEASKQLALSMQNKVDNDSLSALRGAIQTKSADISLDGLEDIVDMYNLENDQPIIAYVSPKAAGQIRLAAGKDWLRGTELGAQRAATGVIGEVLGIQFVRSRKLNANEAIFVLKQKDALDKPALKIMLKARVNSEFERHADSRSTAMYTNSIEAPYLFDPTKVIKVTFNGVEGPKGTDGAPAKTEVDNVPTNVKEENKIGSRSKKGQLTDDKKPEEA